MMFDPDDYDSQYFGDMEWDDSYVECERCGEECVWRCLEGKWFLFDEETDDRHNCAKGVFNV
jgi:hypothetical protein